MTTALEGGEWSAAGPGRTLPPGKTRYPLYRRLGGPQGRSGRAENLAPPRFEFPAVQPVAQSLYRLSHPAHGKAISITYSECVYVALVIQHAKSMRFFILSSVACLAVPHFFTSLIRSTIFRKRQRTWIVFWISLQILPEIFLILRRKAVSSMLSCSADVLFSRSAVYGRYAWVQNDTSAFGAKVFFRSLCYIRTFRFVFMLWYTTSDSVQTYFLLFFCVSFVYILLVLLCLLNSTSSK